MFPSSMKHSPAPGRTTPLRVIHPVGVATLVLLTLSACGGGGDDAGGAASNVGVTLKEWEVVLDEGSATGGDVTFDIKNDGKETHEFVVIKTDLDATELPTAADGSVDEAGSGMEVVDEVEDLPSGQAQQLTVNLDGGNFVLICNIVEKAEDVSHYQNGMRTDFTVE